MRDSVTLRTQRKLFESASLSPTNLILSRGALFQTVIMSHPSCDDALLTNNARAFLPHPDFALALSRKKDFISLSHPTIDFNARLEMGAGSFFLNALLDDL
jgi:hypothetical protein